MTDPFGNRRSAPGWRKAEERAKAAAAAERQFHEQDGTAEHLQELVGELRRSMDHQIESGRDSRKALRQNLVAISISGIAVLVTAVLGLFSADISRDTLSATRHATDVAHSDTVIALSSEAARDASDRAEQASESQAALQSQADIASGQLSSQEHESAAALAVSKETAQNQLRAYISITAVKNLANDSQFSFHFEMKNVGQTPATAVKFKGAPFLVDWPIQDITYKSQLAAIRENIADHIPYSLYPSQTVTSTQGVLSPFGGDLRPDLKSGRKRIVMIATATYQDIYHKVHHSYLCYSFYGENLEIEDFCQAQGDPD